MIVLLGGSGYVGSAFRRAMDSRNIAFVSVSRADCDYTLASQLHKLLVDVSPEFVINAAGFTGKPNVDACEYSKGECIAGNVVLPLTIRDICERLDIPWGHVSSGCIYNGRRDDGRGFNELDPPNFTFRQGICSFYSGCKAMAEELLQLAERCYVWRLRIPFDHRHSDRNYLSKLMTYAQLLDVRNSLSHLDEFVDACLDCWQGRLDFGVYNLTNSGAMSTRAIVELIQRSGVCNRQFRFFESEDEFMRLAAIAPRSSCELDNTKATLAGLRLSPIVDVIQESLANWQCCPELISATREIEY